MKLPSGVFKPYAGVSTAILLFTHTDAGGTDNVWFYDVQADGFSLDDKRTPLLPQNRWAFGLRLDPYRKRTTPEQPSGYPLSLVRHGGREVQPRAFGTELLRPEVRRSSPRGTT